MITEKAKLARQINDHRVQHPSPPDFPMCQRCRNLMASWKPLNTPLWWREKETP